MGDYDVPSNSMRAQEERERQAEQRDIPEERGGITPRKKGFGTFLRQMIKKGDADSLTNIFANAMINAVSDSIDEVTGNMTHRAKTILYGTENYNRGRSGRNTGDRWNSYSKYYDEKNGGRNRPTGSSSRPSGSSSGESEQEYRKWKYSDVLFDERIFGGKRGAELAAWRVIKEMDEQISDPEFENVSVGDFFRFCQQEDPKNPHLKPDFTDDKWGWDDENVIANLRPISVMRGYIIELPKPKYLY